MQLPPVDVYAAVRVVIEMRDQVADGGFAAAGGAHKCKGFAGADIQTDPIQHGFPVLVAIGEIPEFNVPVHGFDGGSVGSVLLHRLVHDFDKALKAGDAGLVLLHEIDKRHDRRDEQADGCDKGGIVSQLHDLTAKRAEQDQSPRNQHDDVKHIGDKGGCRVELSHGAVCFGARLDIGAVPLLEFFLFLCLIGERLGHADAGNTAFQRGVDLRNRDPALPERLPHFSAQNQCRRQQEGDADKDCQRQFPVDRAEVGEGDNDRNGGGNEIFRSVVRQLADVLQVVGHAGHNLSRFVVVIEAVRQAFQMAEHIRAHLRLHPDTHDMTVELDEVIQQHPDDVQEQQSRSAENDCAVTLFRDQIIEHEARDDGIQDSHQGYGKGGKHIQYKQPPMRAIVGNETFQHGTAPCGHL